MNLPSFAHSLWMNSNCRSRCAPTKANRRPRSAPSSSRTPGGSAGHSWCRLIMRCKRTAPITTESRGFIRRTCVPIGDLRPRGSSPNMKALLRFGSAPSSGSSFSGVSASGRPTAPAPDDLGGQPLLLGAVFACSRRVLAEGSYARVQLAEDCVCAIAVQHLGLRYMGGCCGSRPRTQDELAGLERHFVGLVPGSQYPRRLDGRCRRRNRTCCVGQRLTAPPVARWARRLTDRGKASRA